MLGSEVAGSPCINCGLSFDWVRFPLGRPRKDGTQAPGRYCDTCRALPSASMRRGSGHAALLAAKAAYRARQRAERIAA